MKRRAVATEIDKGGNDRSGFKMDADNRLTQTSASAPHESSGEKEIRQNRSIRAVRM